MAFLTTDDGATIWHERSGQGVPVFLQPHPVHFGTFYDSLGILSRDFSLVRHDTRNTGRSESERLMDVSTDRLALDIEAVRALYGFDRIVLIAHSAGGFAAIRYAVRFPGNVAGLILLSASNNLEGLHRLTDPVQQQRMKDPDFIQTSRQLAEEAGSPDFAGNLLPFLANFASTDSGAEVLRKQGITQLGTFCRHNAEALSENEESSVTPEFIDSGVRTTLIAGEAEFVEATPAELLSSFGLPPGSIVHMIPDAGHFTWLEKPGTIELVKSTILRLSR